MGEKLTPGTRHIDEAFDHTFGSGEVRNYPIFKWPDCFDIFVGLFVHLHRFIPHCNRLLGSPVNGNNRGLIYYHFTILDD